MNLQGNAEQQSRDLLQAMRLMFPEAVILVREAREGFGTAVGGPEAPTRAPALRSPRHRRKTSVAWRPGRGAGAAARDTVAPVRISEVMTQGVVTAEVDDSLQRVGELMRDRNVGRWSSATAVGPSG